MDISPMQMCNVLHLLLFYAWIDPQSASELEKGSSSSNWPRFIYYLSGVKNDALVFTVHLGGRRVERGLGVACAGGTVSIWRRSIFQKQRLRYLHRLSLWLHVPLLITLDLGIGISF